MLKILFCIQDFAVSFKSGRSFKKSSLTCGAQTLACGVEISGALMKFTSEVLLFTRKILVQGLLINVLVAKTREQLLTLRLSGLTELKFMFFDNCLQVVSFHRQKVEFLIHVIF